MGKAKQKINCNGYEEADMKGIHAPVQDQETGEWRYNGKFYSEFPTDELEKDERALEDYWKKRFDRLREDEFDR